MLEKVFLKNELEVTRAAGEAARRLLRTAALERLLIVDEQIDYFGRGETHLSVLSLDNVFDDDISITAVVGYLLLCAPENRRLKFFDLGNALVRPPGVVSINLGFGSERVGQHVANRLFAPASVGIRDIGDGAVKKVLVIGIYQTRIVL